jgi:iron complex outermembrane receptor protein
VDVTAQYRLGDNFVVDALISAGRDESYSLNTGGTLNSSAANLALNGTTNSSGSTTQPSIPGQATVVLNLPLTTANALDVWHVGSANQTSAAVKAALLDNRSLTRNVATFQQARLSTNGTLATLPAGDLKVAVGAETVRYQLMQEGVQSNNTGSAANGSTHTLFLFQRTVDSGFLELNVPVIGSDANIPLIQKLEFNISGRYDNYTDAGATQNYKLAFGWELMDGLHFRGNMSTSFVAPGIDVVGDQYSAYLTTQFTGTTITTPIPVASFPQLTQFPATFFNGGAACTTAQTTCTLASNVQGGYINTGDHNAKPQKGRGWELGVDWSPSFIPGLNLQATYWDTQFRGGITGPNVGNIVNTPALNKYLVLYPGGISAAQISAAATGIRQSGSIPSTGYFLLYSVGTNLLDLYISGVDTSFRYNFDTDWGAMHVGGTGSIFTKYDQAYGGGAVFNILNTTNANTSFPSVQTQVRLNAGWEQGPFSADLYMNYTGGYRNWSGTSLTPLTKDVAGNPTGGGDPVKANVTFDLHLGYEFTTDYLGGEDEVSLTIRNVFDKDPPFYLSSSGYDNWVGSPLGRVITIGLKAKL